MHRLAIGLSTSLDILDLGCGTGTNLRHLAPLLAAAGAREQHWTCIDIDTGLLSRLPARCAAWAASCQLGFTDRDGEIVIEGSDWHCRVRGLQQDLAAKPERLPWPACGLVTASALLDLVSAPWLDALLERCTDARCRLLFALTYDGRCRLDPTHADDAMVLDLVNRHQRTDKGFGPALGPGAAHHCAARCTALGYDVAGSPSDWQIAPDAAALQRALIDGWRQAVLAMDASRSDRIDAWHAARLGLIEKARSRIMVGHRDLVATIDTVETAA